MRSAKRLPHNLLEIILYYSIFALVNINQNRIIGRYEGEHRGPLIICIGAMHGNEPAGVQAIDTVIKMLEVEPIRNPDFCYRGRLLGLVGNLQAYSQGKRYIDRDLNRSFDAGYLAQLLDQSPSSLSGEDRELVELDTLIRAEIADYKPEKVILLDLHTTSSKGGVFTICRDRQQDLEIGAALHAPIVLGMLKGLKGTTLHYFVPEVLDIDIIPITFESGQHQEKMAVNRAVAGIISCMKAIDAIDADVVENHHEQLLVNYCAPLPKVTELEKVHAIEPEDGFEMRKGYENFQEVTAGEVIAQDKDGFITIEEDCRILMPLYQAQGEDGFFLVKEINRNI